MALHVMSSTNPSHRHRRLLPVVARVHGFSRSHEPMSHHPSHNKIKRGGQVNGSSLLAAQELSRKRIYHGCRNSICQRKWPRTPVSKKKCGNVDQLDRRGSERWPRRIRYSSLKLNLTVAYPSTIYCLVIAVNSCIQSLPISATQPTTVGWLLMINCSLCVARTRDNLVRG
jgi:hypothetical protein